MNSTRTAPLTGISLVAFASNSLLCRFALGGGTIDAASFSTIRLVSGALTLLLLSAVAGRGALSISGSWKSAFYLFLYAFGFSFAYRSLSVGTGALILFGSVQATMIVAAIRSSERPHRLELAGIAIALAGLVYLVLPGLQAPSPIGAGLMAIAGVSWAIYTLRGRASREALLETAGNFVRAVPLAIAVSLLAANSHNLTRTGALFAIVSGAIASGVGYVIWYAALRRLTSTQAALSQMLVPILAAIGGIVLMSEELTLRLTTASVLILGGIVLGLSWRWKRAARIE